MSEYLSIMMKFASARHNPFFHLFPPLWHVSSAETSNPTSLINYANLIHASFATSSPSPFSTLFLLSLSQFSRLVIWIFVTPWTTACQASLSITNSKSLLKLMSIESVMPFNHLILCCPLLLLPSIFPRIRVFSNELALHIRWPKYWSFGFSVSPSNVYSGLISFRMDLLDLLAVQGTLKGYSKHHNSKASIFWHSAFIMVQLSHPYMTTGKTIPLTTWAFVGKVMPLPFNTEIWSMPSEIHNVGREEAKV